MKDIIGSKILAFEDIFKTVLDCSSVWKSHSFRWLPLDAAATPKLWSTTLGLDKHYAAVKINNEIKTRISKFPRSYSDLIYDFKISKYTYSFKYHDFSIASTKKTDYYIHIDLFLFNSFSLLICWGFFRLSRSFFIR